MKHLPGIALGFALMPATIGLIGLFVWTGIHYELSRADTAVGMMLGIATLILVIVGGVIWTVARS